MADLVNYPGPNIGPVGMRQLLSTYLEWLAIK